MECAICELPVGFEVRVGNGREDVFRSRRVSHLAEARMIALAWKEILLPTANSSGVSPDDECASPHLSSPDPVDAAHHSAGCASGTYRRAFERIQAEFLEMPGMALTPAQVSRLSAVDLPTCQSVLRDLADAGILRESPGGTFARARQ